MVTITGFREYQKVDETNFCVLVVQAGLQALLNLGHLIGSPIAVLFDSVTFEDAKGISRAIDLCK